MLSDDNVTEIIQTLKHALSPSLVYLFGSQAYGNPRHDSDLDIAYLSEMRISPYDRFLLAQKLANIVDKEVDLVDLGEASTVFQMQVVSRGKVLYSSDEGLRENYTMNVYKMFARLNEERRPVLEKIAQGGKL